jgi:hypothetical protein
MKNDPHLNLFMCYLSLFTFFMCVLVTAQDLIVMLVGWEGIINTECPSGFYGLAFFGGFDGFGGLKRTARIPANKRVGLHTSLFKQILTGLLLGDG